MRQQIRDFFLHALSEIAIDKAFKRNLEYSRGVLRVGQDLLAVDEATFKSRASRSFVQGTEVYAASFSMDSATSHWRPHLVTRGRLAERPLAQGR